MSKAIAFAAGVLLTLCMSAAPAQPTESPDQTAQAVNTYLYMRDGGGNKVYIETKFWRNDPNYDARALRRLSDVMSGLEKIGYKHSDDAANGWDKPEKVVRCRINLESTTKRWRGQSGALVSCEGTGISEAEVRPSEDPQHVKKVLDAFSKQFSIAKSKIG